VERRDRDGDEDHHRGLGRIGDGGERVGGEDGEREGLRDQRLVELTGRPRTTHEHALRDVEALRALRRT
jgi:hypothetical protein